MSKEDLSHEEEFWADDLDTLAEDDYVSPLAGDGDEDEVVFEDDLETSLAADDSAESEEVSFEDDEDSSGEEAEDVSFDEEAEDLPDLLEPLENIEPLEGVVVPVSDDEPAPLSLEEATELTEHIRSTADVLYVLVARAHAGKAHLALGYKNFEAYVKAEFNISRSRAYQFLNQANVIAAIEAAAPEGTHFRLSEAAARDLRNFVDELAPDVAEKTEGLSPSEAGKVVEDLVADYREKAKKPVEEEEDDFDLNDIDLSDVEFDMPDFGDSESKGGGSEFDDMENFDDIDDLLDDSNGIGGDSDIDDPSVFRSKVENVYAFYTALTALEKMPDAHEIIDSIQPARKSHVDSSLPKAKAWLDSVFELWNAQNSEENTEDFESDAEEGVRDESEEFDAVGGNN